jgi:hypothetical protein
MPTYADLDACKTCRALLLAIYQDCEEFRGRDASLADGLQRSALRAAGKLAFGRGTGSKRMLRHAAERAAGHLSKVGHDLAIAAALGLIEKERYQELDALRGRANFYVWKLILPDLPAEADDPEGGRS